MSTESPKGRETAIAEKKDACRAHYAFSTIREHPFWRCGGGKALDAVIVWDVIARYYRDYGTEAPILVEKNLIFTIDIGVLKFTKHRKLAEKFVDFLVSKQGQGIFEKHNYRTTPPQ